MDIYVYDFLDKRQIEDIKLLVDERKNYENSSLEFPYDDKDSVFVLIYDNDKLLFCMALSFINTGSYELIFFSLPKDDEKELFKAAFNRLRLYMREALSVFFAEILLLSDTDSGAKLAKELDFPLFNKEFYLYYDYKGFRTYDNKIYSNISFDFGDFITYHISDERKGYKNFLKFNITKFSEDTFYLYGFYVKERYRNKKNAKKALPYILQLLYEGGVKKILLQVSGFNKAALSLYKGLGFKAYQEISYYKVRD